MAWLNYGSGITQNKTRISLHQKCWLTQKDANVQLLRVSSENNVHVKLNVLTRLNINEICKWMNNSWVEFWIPGDSWIDLATLKCRATFPKGKLTFKANTVLSKFSFIYYGDLW